MLNDDFMLYALALVALVIGVLIIKKVASCLIKIVVLLVLLAVAGFIYYTQFYAGA